MEVNLTPTADEIPKTRIVDPQRLAGSLPMVVTSTISNNDIVVAESANIGPIKKLSSTSAIATANSAKTLKRCLSVPIIEIMPGCGTAQNIRPVSTITTRAAAAAAAAAAEYNRRTMSSTAENSTNIQVDTPKKHMNFNTEVPSLTLNVFGNGSHIGIPRSNPCSREVSPAPGFNIFPPRARRYSASYSPMNTAAIAATTGGAPLCLTPRVSQLRKEESIDMSSREINHEREVHSAMQMSQSWEDLTLVAENWSCKSEEFSNPLQVMLPSTAVSCSSPSPTSNRGNLRLPYGLSPSPTRRTFATRRSMSPIAMRPSQLGPVKRKFEIDDNVSNWNIYSPPPLKKIFVDSRGSSPVCQSPSSVCLSPDSGTYDGRITPKLFISKLCTTNTNNSSACSSPSSSVMGIGDSIATSALWTNTTTAMSSTSSPLSSSSLLGATASEPMVIATSSNSNIDEGICSETDEKSIIVNVRTRASSEMQDDASQMDDIKSETSSIGGCSSISIESSSWECAGVKATSSFLNKLIVDDASVSSSSSTSSTSILNNAALLGQKNFFINKQGLSGPRKYIVNHENLLISNCNENADGAVNVTSTTNNAANVSSASTYDVEDIVSPNARTLSKLSTSVIVKNAN